jgi:uncharacterized protein YegL
LDAAPRPAPSEVARGKKSAAAGAPTRSAGLTSPKGLAEADEASTALSVARAGVRAGEWDDNANYRDFLGYIGNAQNLGIERLHVTSRRFLTVVDASGRGVPNCAVTVSDGQRRVTLKTAASGRAILFPGLHKLTAPRLTAETSCVRGAEPTRATFSTEADDDVVVLEVAARRPASRTPAVDVVFALDTTGSMSEEISSIKDTLQMVIEQVGPRVAVRVGLVEYRDRSDSFVTRIYPLTDDLGALSHTISRISADGGGDTPEDVLSALAATTDEMNWDKNASARLAFLVADAPPHLDYRDSRPYAESVRRANTQGIKFFTISASGMDHLGQAVFRQIAQATGGTNMFVLRGGAGPQSTGAGDAKSSCGGTHENYTSGNLDQLITRKIDLEVASIEANPLEIAGLGRDENAKPCRERVVLEIAR